MQAKCMNCGDVLAMSQERQECSCGESYIELSAETHRAGGHLSFFRDKGK